MGKWKKPQGKEHRWNRAALIKRDGTLCQLCKEPIDHMCDVTIDHINTYDNNFKVGEFKRLDEAITKCENLARTVGYRVLSEPERNLV